MTTLDDRPTTNGCRPDDRCSCSHTRAAHVGRAVLFRDDPGLVEAGDLIRDGYLGRDPVGRLWRTWPMACALMLCRCEIFRGEADR